MTGGNLSDRLIAAAALGDTVRIRDLLEAGADPNLRDEHGATPLHDAVAALHVDAAACLLAYGADHTVVNGDGRMPLAADFCRLDALHGIRQRHHRRTFNGTRPRLASRMLTDGPPPSNEMES